MRHCHHEVCFIVCYAVASLFASIWHPLTISYLFLVFRWTLRPPPPLLMKLSPSNHVHAPLPLSKARSPSPDQPRWPPRVAVARAITRRHATRTCWHWRHPSSEIFSQVTRSWLCLLPQKKVLCKQKIPVTSNLRYMHGVLNVDEIKN
jgi:hypothetical protein